MGDPLAEINGNFISSCTQGIRLSGELFENLFLSEFQSKICFGKEVYSKVVAREDKEWRTGAQYTWQVKRKSRSMGWSRFTTHDGVTDDNDFAIDRLKVQCSPIKLN